MLDRTAAFLDRLLAYMDTGSHWLARAGGVLILATVALVIVEILSRQLLGRSTAAATELSGYVLAISASWAFAYSLFRKAHIRIDVVYMQMPLTIRAVLDAVALATLGLFCILVVGAAADVAWSSFQGGSRANTPLATPLWIPQGLWAVGLAWFAAAVTVLLLRVIVALVAADPRSVQRVAGSATLEEQTAAPTTEDNQ